ncbi:BAG domain-containing protein starvin isoform X2 [Anticarsia gemmatalis]|uniref:BAG domain-containing protein starvin isoform X2 n=1 Tax=Anticarsia gemmatalis TaxID=129554 RepID=UPI003F75B2C4
MPLRGRSFRGFPFDEDEGSGAWSELAARHPDIAARLRQRPATWARKRRPSSQDATDDFGDGFGGFDRFPFDDIPPEFREHFPSHWNRRFGARDEPPHPEAHPQQTQAAPQSPPAHQQTTATQTEQEPGPQEHEQPTHLPPQYGLRNTVSHDLGQKSAADPSLVDADDRNQRSMSAPPDSSAPPNQSFKMSGQNHQEHPHAEQHSNVRHIPIFVEGRDEPVINKSVDHGTHFGDTKPAYQSPPQQQPHIDRDQYFADDGPVGFHHPPNFSRAFGTPFNKGFRQGPQPFVQQKVYPQAAYTRGASPHRSQSPKPQTPDEHYVKVPVHHDHNAAKTEPPSRPQQRQAPPQQHQPPPQPQPKQPPPPQQQQRQPSPQQQAPQREQTPPQPKQQPSANDPITLILSIQTDVLNLMTEVENFKGTKKDKKYLFLDEMLTRNLIKLDNIETDGKENIRQARKEAIKCIQKCIAVLEAKADSNANVQSQPQADVEMKENVEAQAAEPVTENGEVEMNEATKEQGQGEPQPEQPAEVATQEVKTEPQPQEPATDAKVEDKPEPPVDNKEATQTQAADTRPDDKAPEQQTKDTEQKDEEKSPKSKIVKKVDKSKDKKDKDECNDSSKQDKEDSNKEQKQVEEKSAVDIMQVDDKVDKTEAQVMEVDGAASQ